MAIGKPQTSLRARLHMVRISAAGGRDAFVLVLNCTVVVPAVSVYEGIDAEYVMSYRGIGCRSSGFASWGASLVRAQDLSCRSCIAQSAVRADSAARASFDPAVVAMVQRVIPMGNLQLTGQPCAGEQVMLPLLRLVVGPVGAPSAVSTLTPTINPTLTLTLTVTLTRNSTPPCAGEQVMLPLLRLVVGLVGALAGSPRVRSQVKLKTIPCYWSIVLGVCSFEAKSVWKSSLLLQFSQKSLVFPKITTLFSQAVRHATPLQDVKAQ